MEPIAPALLTSASYYGTLAAVRCLGRRAVPVTLAETHWLAPGRWSRYVRRVLPAPDPDAPEALLDWLLHFGAREPCHVLYPATDETAWLIARHRDALSAHFRLYSPPVGAVYGLLDKRRLAESAARVGLGTPRTWFPTEGADLSEVVAEARFPVLLKPRTQVLLAGHGKGERVDQPGELAARYRAYRDQTRIGRALLRDDPDAALPMIQEFHAGAAQGIYSVSGFRARTGELVARASVKVLQRPRKLGIGLCFEEAPLRSDVLAGLEALCREVGYFGVFEAEFLVDPEGRVLLIDFNPRFFSQMAFDIDRGVLLPYLAYLGALDDHRGLAVELAAAREAQELSGRVYCHHFVLEVMLRSQHLSGRLDDSEVDHWRTWWRTHRARTDAVAQAGDALPALVDVAQHVVGYARHPRAFLNSMVLDR